MKLEAMKNTELFDLEQTIAARLFTMYTYPWEALPNIGKCITSIGKHLPEEEYAKLGKNIWIHKTAKMATRHSFGEIPLSEKTPLWAIPVN